MTLDEVLAREAIRDTMAKCAQAGDRLHAEDYAACYAEDGILQTGRVSGGHNLRLVGRPEILAWQKGLLGGDGKSSALARPGRVALTFVRHNLATSKIDITGFGTATARTYWHVITDIGPDHSGYYLDDFRKVDDEWLIAFRRARTDWASPDSLMVPPGSLEKR